MKVALARRIAIGVSAVGIAGMIVSNIAGSDGWPIVFGLVTAASAGALILVTSVTTGAVVADGELEVLGPRVEERAAALVDAGADEVEVRALVADAVRLGRAGKG